MSELIELREVTVVSGTHEVLKNVSVSFPEGMCTVIMGPSGCGKSTLLKVAAGLVPPDTGSLLYRGEDFFRLPERGVRELRRVNGFQFQDSALWENKTIFENLALPLQVHAADLTQAELRGRIERMLELGGLSGSAALRPAELSVGERKMASFLRALIGEPSLVFMDTPTGTIDARMAEVVTSMIREIKAKGRTIIAVTHDRRIASTMADRLVILSEGSLVASGWFDEVKRSTDPRVRAILVEVLGEIASFDTDLLSLLDGPDQN